LAVQTPAKQYISSGTVDIATKYSAGKRSGNPAERFLGIVSSDDKGVEVQSISGTASLKTNGLKTKEVPSGGSILVGPGNDISAYQTAKEISNTKKCDKYKKPKKHKSPYTFGDDSDYCYDD
jgi:hypothetical protein